MTDTPRTDIVERGPWHAVPDKPYRVELSLSCGWVIVDPDGHESTLGHLRRVDADRDAKVQCAAYRRGLKDAEAEIVRLRAVVEAARVIDKLEGWQPFHKMSDALERLRAALAALDAQNPPA